MSGQQRAQRNSSPACRDPSLAGADKKASRPKYKTLRRGSLSCGSYDELYNPQESRFHQLQMQIDPRRHVLDVLDRHSQRDKVLSGSERRTKTATGKAPPTLTRSSRMRHVNLAAPPTTLAPDPMVGIQGIIEPPTLKRSSRMRDVNLAAPLTTLAPDPMVGIQGIIEPPALIRYSSMRDVNLAAPPRSALLRSTSELSQNAFVEEVSPMDESPASVSSPNASSPHDRPADVPPPWRTFSEPGRMPRRWANRARPPDAHPASLMPPSERIRVSWLPLARSFTSEFFPERLRPPRLFLRHSASVPLPPKLASVTSSALERSSKTDRLRKIATRLLPTRLSRIVAELSAREV